MSNTKKKEPILEAIGISKWFPGVRALTKADITLHKGEVVALLGENGAGKSTLIKVLSGIYIPEEGSIKMHGKPISFNVPYDAIRMGIGVIHQELNYVGSISIAENIFMGRLILKRGGWVDHQTMYELSERILATVGLTINPRQRMGLCTVAQKQLIEIAKVLYFDAKVLILDEPTSALNDVEIEYLFKLIHQAASEGIAILYISHKLEELFAVADRVVVLRDGLLAGTVDIADTTKDELIAMMVGRKIDDMYPRTKVPLGEQIFAVEGLTTEFLNDVSFEIHKGEILGIYGLMGSGHTVIGPALFGKENLLGGHFSMQGKELSINHPLDAILHGLAYVPSDRKTEGLVLNQTVEVNITAGRYCKERSFWLQSTRDKQITNHWIDELRIRTPSGNTIVESLSGGNQQKVVLARWLELSPDVLILNEPTRGIDVGAKAEIYRILNSLCAEGKCIILITSEMPELLAMSDRIVVMFEGCVSGYLETENASQEDVVRLAIGHKGDM